MQVTQLSATGTPGRVVTFSPKEETSIPAGYICLTDVQAKIARAKLTAKIARSKLTAMDNCP